MDYPKRTTDHVTETDSWKILKDRAPSEWIIREVSERDYGIDSYIEIPRNNGDMAGDLMSIQLKGIQALDWSKDGSQRAMFSGIKKSTINYWMGLPVPVFLVVSDLNSRKAFFAPVKAQVRQRYDEYLKQGTFGFELFEAVELRNDAARVYFIVEYLRERQLEQFESAILTVQSHWASYLQFIDRNANLDAHSGVDDEVEVMFVQIIKTVSFLGGWLGLKLELPTLEQIYKEDGEAFKSQWYYLHHWSLNKVMPTLRNALFEVMIKIKTLLTEKQREYWSQTQPTLYRVAMNLDIEVWRNQVHY